VHFGVAFAEVLDFGIGVHNGGMVPAAEVAADFLQAVLRELPGKIHTNLSWFGYTLATLLALKVS